MRWINFTKCCNCKISGHIKYACKLVKKKVGVENKTPTMNFLNIFFRTNNNNNSWQPWELINLIFSFPTYDN